MIDVGKTFFYVNMASSKPSSYDNKLVQGSPFVRVAKRFSNFFCWRPQKMFIKSRDPLDENKCIKSTELFKQKKSKNFQISKFGDPLLKFGEPWS